MTHPRSATTTVLAVLGADTVVENALAKLLEGEGYATRVLKTCPKGEALVEEMPVGGVPWSTSRERLVREIDPRTDPQSTLPTDLPPLADAFRAVLSTCSALTQQAGVSTTSTGY